MTDEVYRASVDSWDDVEFVMTGTADAVDGDGLTMSARSLQPTEKSVLEIVVDGEVRGRFIRE
ncbi:hypothetical protein E6P09_09490 [Haloferax mediterranei ATCC 33500]|uniref:Uncharacterized protein n=1 Tax=Haloferax mediterranei (strain ATCC 33500 / DSM 1411 / JCM 8866 / NBRC 14739 / NCIMB 2177 / R-4) TaxID=523841 RepID=I3R449_HALMT|nr:hypothetical protein [Haloferax mediterranei]AFK19009.1 hypothetical protein HFX_1297 [Haloferax mediterranei ATCC 33500]AHZ21634.1 hypothetical protein BM92_02710 [Haloferax mediterranei ATCC 33500]EMA03551.1 hypothetical protein C439_04030 [Haloferax mediterranei ATCC 33500]MDX5989101.1 hypothetical protein [Haloferax mediterranei ATCC 33500]QCQ75487.1 hypothetical protein E6P09_09490 [Haloferax mediterranei ATCC 33500]